MPKMIENESEIALRLGNLDKMCIVIIDVVGDLINRLPPVALPEYLCNPLHDDEKSLHSIYLWLDSKYQPSDEDRPTSSFELKRKDAFAQQTKKSEPTTPVNSVQTMQLKQPTNQHSILNSNAITNINNINIQDYQQMHQSQQQKLAQLIICQWQRAVAAFHTCHLKIYQACHQSVQCHVR